MHMDANHSMFSLYEGQEPSQTRVIHHAVQLFFIVLQERGRPHTGSISSGISRACGTGRVGFLSVEKFTLPETNVTPESLRLEAWEGLFSGANC